MRLSSLALLLANAVPLAGVIFWGWDSVLVLALFWVENLVIGALNAIKMAWVSTMHKDASGIVTILFFLVHYGAFCAAHGVLLASLLGQDVATEAVLGRQFDGIGAFFMQGVAVLVHFMTTLAPAIWLGVAALLMSQMSSLIENFILRGEMFKLNAKKLMAKPYHQIVVMHVGLILGAFLMQRLGSPTWMLALIVALKMGADFVLFQRRHKNQTPAVLARN